LKNFLDGGSGYKEKYLKGPQSINISEAQPPSLITWIAKSIVLAIFLVLVLAVIYFVGTIITGEGM
jgi:hypothetical protein